MHHATEVAHPLVIFCRQRSAFDRGEVLVELRPTSRALRDLSETRTRQTDRHRESTRSGVANLVSSLVTICYLAVLMSKRKFTKRKVATPDLDPATLAQLKVLERERKRANRALLKRRRQKSGQ